MQCAYASLVEPQQFPDDGDTALGRGDVCARGALHVGQSGQFWPVLQEELHHLRVVILSGQVEGCLPMLHMIGIQ